MKFTGRRAGLGWFIGALCFWIFTISTNAQDSVSLRRVAGQLGMEASWDKERETVQLRSQWTQLDFTLNSRLARLDGRKLFLSFPIRQETGWPKIRSEDLQKTLLPILTPQRLDPTVIPQQILIDPGHGGKDPGARNPPFSLEEKNLTLSLAKRLAKELRQAGFEVELTRDSDRFLELSERAAIANSKGADLFISLHFNSSVKTEPSGFETFALTPVGHPSTGTTQIPQENTSFPGNAWDEWNTLLAFYAQRALLDSFPGEVDRGLKRARFVVLKEISMPGILVECGFISNPESARQIPEPDYMDRTARAIRVAAEEFRRTVERVRRDP